MKTTKTLIFNPSKCTGCGICMLVCGYHHKRTFSFTTGSLQVNRNLFENEIDIEWFQKAYQNHLACNLCINEENGPQCVIQCPEKVITQQED